MRACAHSYIVDMVRQVVVVVALEREQDGIEQPAVHAPRFPGRKDEGWWLVVGDPKANSLLAIKRVNLGKAAKVGRRQGRLESALRAMLGHA